MTANPTPSRPKRYSVSCCNLDFPDPSSPGEGKAITAWGEEVEAPGCLSPAGHFSRPPPPPCVKIPAPLDRKGRNQRRGGAGTGEGAWQAGVSAAGCRSTLPPQLPPPNTYPTISGTPLSSPSSPQRRQVDRDAGKKKQPPPPPLAFGPLLGTGVGKKGRQASRVWEDLPFPAASEPVSKPQRLPLSPSAN